MLTDILVLTEITIKHPTINNFSGLHNFSVYFSQGEVVRNLLEHKNHQTDLKYLIFKFNGLVLVTVFDRQLYEICILCFLCASKV